jgi:hypothetical protein
MRRFVAMTMAILLSLALAAPLFAAPAASDLPACCRRNGSHHCMGGMQMSDDETGISAVAAKCPRCPTATPAHFPHSFTPDLSPLAGALIATGPTALPQTEARYRISYARTRQKRGPPVILL